MKIKTKELSYEEVMALPRAEHKLPRKPSRILHTVMRLASIPDLRAVNFKVEDKDLQRAGNGPWLVLMNHSSFLDFEILSRILYPKPYHIVATSDGFVGKEWLMRGLGCIPTQKFVRDVTLLTDIRQALQVNRESVVLYPEASYSFDGTTTPLPRRLGRLFKLMGVPVVMITTYGSFTRDPLYNNLQKRKVNVSARVECLFTPEETRSMSDEELDGRLDKAFALDYFTWQKENGVRTPEPFRADGLNRILYKCPACGSEGSMRGEGILLKCGTCGKTYRMEEDGSMLADSGTTEYQHIPDWYAWERECVKIAVSDGSYSMDLKVRIGMMVDFKAIYMVGNGTLRHDLNGFVLDGCEGKLHFEQGPLACYSVYSDYFWYEIGDVVCIGNKDVLYYCFPEQKDVVAKIRLAAEEIFKLNVREGPSGGPSRAMGG